MYNNEKYKARAYTNKLLEGLQEGLIDGETLAEELLSWISEDDVEEFAKCYEYIEDEEDDEEDDEEGGNDD